MVMHGRYEFYGGHEHFIPNPLSTLPEIILSGERLNLFAATMSNLQKVETLSKNIPNSKTFIRAYAIKEALLSSEIEGTITTLTEVMGAQNSKIDPENRDIQDVLNYIGATDQALKMLREEGFPLVERVIKSAHRELLSGTSGESKRPGEYRMGTVSVGSHIPPPAQHIPHLMRDWESFVNAEAYPPLIKAGIAHAQFEIIHPFLDGNGRIGRLLIILGFIADGLQEDTLLYPSYYFKRFRSEYYSHLDDVRRRGNWDNWLNFYLRAINETAMDATRRMENLIAVTESYRQRIKEISTRSGDALLKIMLASPVFSVTQLAKSMGYSYMGAKAIVDKLERAGVLAQHNRQRRFKKYRLDEYMRVLEEETAF